MAAHLAERNAVAVLAVELLQEAGFNVVEADMLIVDPIEEVVRIADFKLNDEPIPTFTVERPQHTYGKRARRAQRGGNY